MRATFRLPLPVRLAAAAALAVAGLGLAAALRDAPRGAAPATETAFVSPAAARALGARWRQTRRAETEVDYAQALLAAGLSGELLEALANDGLFAKDPAAHALFRAEALLRLYRYADAAAAASVALVADNPYAAFIRVRAQAGAGGGLDRDALALATRGPPDLAREAWLLRARAALDASDFAAADASLKRAAEVGATKARLEPFRVERDIRAGNKDRAAAVLAARAESLSKMAAERGETLPDYEGLRLAAMLALRAGDGREAARLADRAGLGTPGGPDAALAALAKWMAGDSAQAEAILSAHLRAAPGDWIARDLAAAIAFGNGKPREGEAHLALLAESNASLAAFRRMNRALARRDLDGALQALAQVSGEAPVRGAAFALLGEGTAIGRLPEPNDADRALVALAGASDQRAARAAASKLLGLRRTPVDLAAAASALERVGLDDEAAALAFDASRAENGFFAPVALRARALEKMGREAEALGHLDGFIGKNPKDPEARIARARLSWRLGDVEAAVSGFAAIDAAVLFADADASLDYAAAAARAGEPWRGSMIDAARASSPSSERLARVLEIAGEAQAAAEAYRDALIDAPDAVDLANSYRRLMAQLGREPEADAFFAAIARRRAGPDPKSGGA
jgi:hypothetical protein